MGLLVFTVKASVPDSDVTLSDIFKGSIPYWLIIILVASLIMVFPEISLWLPNLLL